MHLHMHDVVIQESTKYLLQVKVTTLTENVYIEKDWQEKKEIVVSEQVLLYCHTSVKYVDRQ